MKPLLAENDSSVVMVARRVLVAAIFRVVSAFHIFLLGLVMTGCATLVPPPSALQTGNKNIPVELALGSWAYVLENLVDEQGRVDFNLLKMDPAFLEKYVSYLAETSPEKNPESFPTDEKRLAYFLNSYNALAMYGLIVHNFPGDLFSFWDRARFFKFTRFHIGGKEISLYDYENDVIRPLGDPRVHFALNCMVKACPRLPQTPFQAKTLDATLDMLAREFVNHPRHVRISRSKGIVQLSEIFRFYKKDFVNPKTASSLIAYINKYRDVPLDENLKIKFIDYDWVVNYK
jgi:hypothetical protein